MKFRSEIELGRQRNPINMNSQILLMGSCFAEHMGEKLNYFKFRESTNPFGIIFHAPAIENLITRAINNEIFSNNDLFQQDGIWHSFEAHSSLSESEETEVVANLNNSLEDLRNSLHHSDYLIVTLGTAWVYRYIEEDRWVANCHKVPQKKFLKELLKSEEVLASLDRLVTLVRSENPGIEIILTVSPVRHLKDGMVENNRSKANLLTAVHEIVESYKGVRYFPSYEIVMDDLRDYRFYAEDLVHPNELAVDYIWEKFKNSWIDSECHPVLKEIDGVQKGLNHRPFNQDSDSHREFQQNLKESIKALQAQFPHLNF